MFIPASQNLNLDLVPNDPTVMAAAIHSPQSIKERKITPKDSPEQVESTFPPSPATTVETPSSPPSPPVSRPSSAVVPARRGPGRPSKAQLAAQKTIGKGLSARASASARREMHNDSAMRSRIRLNSTIDELWDSVPKSARSQYHSVTSTWNPVGGRIDPLRELSRAEKVAIALSYLRKLKGDGVEMC
jgi:hypothetical protein